MLHTGDPPERSVPVDGAATRPPMLSSVKLFTPPASSPSDVVKPILVIHTLPQYMARLQSILRTFDRPPQKLLLEFKVIEMSQDDLSQLRTRLSHPTLDGILGGPPAADHDYHPRPPT